MKQFNCSELMPGCDWHARAHSETALIEMACLHLRAVHGREFNHPIMIIRLRERVRECPWTPLSPGVAAETWRDGPGATA